MKTVTLEKLCDHWACTFLDQRINSSIFSFCISLSELILILLYRSEMDISKGGTGWMIMSPIIDNYNSSAMDRIRPDRESLAWKLNDSFTKKQSQVSLNTKT